MSEVVHPAPGWLGAIRVYRDPRLWYIFLLGCSSGYPWVLISSAMTGWLKDANLSRAAISYFGSVTAVYAINFLWAPLLDRVKIPFLSHRLGQRRSWILSLQLCIVLLTLGIALTNPAASLMWTSLLALAIAAAAASMDIAIDGYRIDIIGQDPVKLPAASAMVVAGWWTGYSLPGYLAFHYADRYGWSAIYLGLAVLLAVLALGTFLVREPDSNRDLLQQQAAERYQNSQSHPALLWLQVTVLEPFAEFIRRNGLKVSVLLILFILTFKLGESFLGRMSIQFYREVGFSNEQIAVFSRLYPMNARPIQSAAGRLIKQSN